MPILDVEIVTRPGAEAPLEKTQELADRVGEVLGTAPGRTWVRLRVLPREQYAENEAQLPRELAPVFVQLLEAEPATGDALAARVLALTRVVAAVLGRADSEVHVLVQPPALGRIAFGGRLRTS